MHCPLYTGVTFYQKETRTFVSVVGEFDRRERNSFLEFAAKVQAVPRNHVRVNLTQVTQMDAGAIPGLLALRQAALDGGGHFQVFARAPFVVTLLQEAGISAIIVEA